MTYFQAVKMWRRKDLTAHEQIMRNLTIAIGNVKIAIVFTVVAIIVRLVKVL